MQPEENERLLKYLLDVLIAAKELNNFQNRKLSDYAIKANRWMVERGIEIISEALKRATSIQPDLPISNLPQIFRMRNRINHEYDKIEESHLYMVVQKSIPVLVQEVEALINHFEEE